MATTIWTDTLGGKYAATIDQLARAVRDCPDELWEESVWEVKKEHQHVWPVRRVDDKPSRATATEALLPVYSAFWNVANHTLFHLDFYLSGAVLKGFVPPAPFREDEHRANVVPNRPYTRAELQSYITHNREKARATFETLTETQAARVLTRTGHPFADLLLTNLLHAQEHAAQLHLFLGQHGVEPTAGATVEQRRQILREGVAGRSDAEIDAFVKSIGGYARMLPRVLAGFCTRLEPRDPCVVRFDVGDGYFIRATPGTAAVEKSVPSNIDATVRVSPQDFLRWMTGNLEFASAAADGRITIDGEAAALRGLFGTLRPRKG
jgi:hypothetical protein